MKTAVRSGPFLVALFLMALATTASTATIGPEADRPFQSYLSFVASLAPAPSTHPSWGAPLAISPSDGLVWVANPDAGSVSVVAPDSLEKIAEVAVGQEPWSLALAPDGRRVYVLDRALGNLVVVDALAKKVEASLPVGPEPGGLALTPSGARAYVSLTAAAQLLVVDTAGLQIVATISVGPRPFAVAISNDGDEDDADEKVTVTHLEALPRPGGEEGRDDGREGRVTVLDVRTGAIRNEIALGPDEHGFPNLLTAITLWGDRAWVPHVRAAPDLPQGLTSTVFAAVSVLDLARGVEDVAAHLPLNDQEIFGSPVNNPVAAVPAPNGQTLYIVLAGSNLVEVVDLSTPSRPRLVTFLPTGQNPRGMALSADGRRGYVMSYLSRSLTVLDLESLAWVAEIPLTAETLPPDVLRGKILFNSAADPRLSQGSWISCASCHPDGGSDGVTWLFPDGPRQTPPLWQASETLPWHWSAALDEAQDVEETVQLIQHGLGLAHGADPALLGTPNAGRSADLDALAAFLASGIRTPEPPAADHSAGRDLFLAAGCAACHGGPTGTSSRLPAPPGGADADGNGMVDDVLVDVGTLNPRDVRGAAGFDPPSLLGVGLTAPYFHDGAMPTLEALLASGHPNPDGAGNGLSPAEIRFLAQFLGSIGPATPPVPQDLVFQE